MNTFSKIATAMLVILISLSSCNKDKGETGTSDEYYLKYVVKCSQGRWYVSSFSIRTDNGTQYFKDYKSTYWTQTYGPVKKGFTAYATAAQSPFPTIEIYVSKNQSPFSLKASKTGSNEVSASYTIDF